MISHTQEYIDPIRDSSVTITFFEKELEAKDDKGKTSFKKVDFFTYQQSKHNHKIERFAYQEDKMKYADIWNNYLRKKKGNPLSSIFDKKIEDFLKSKKIDCLETLIELSQKKVEQLGQSGKEWQNLAIQFLNEKEDVNPRKSSLESKEMKSILNILSPAQKDLLPEEMKNKYA